MNNNPPKSNTGFAPKKRREFFNYFGKDRFIHVWFAEKRTRLIGAIVPVFTRLGLVPDTISYIGIALLAGVCVYFVRAPVAAALFLLGHIICDGLDGAYARHADKASQSGAFTDLVCDQLGMVVVATLAVFHHFVYPLIGAIYITLYLIVVVFGVIINVMGLRTRITITSKFFLYAVYGIWVVWGENYFPQVMTFFSVVMAVEVVVGYVRLKRGIRKKFDTEVRFTEGDPYTGGLNYALNVSVPLVILLAIVIAGNLVPIRAILNEAGGPVEWKAGPVIVDEKELGYVVGFGARDDELLVLMMNARGNPEMRGWSMKSESPSGSFAMPQYLDSWFGSLPTDDDVVLVGDRTTRLIMGIDLESSFQAGSAVIVSSLPVGHLRVTGMAVTRRNGGTVWIAANYLYTRRTYVIAAHRALEQGNLLDAVEASYINAGFPSGIAVRDGMLFSLNRSPFNSLMYVAPLEKLLSGTDLLSGSVRVFEPPEADAIGPVIHGSDLLMISPRGRVYRTPTAPLLEAGTDGDHEANR